MKEMPMNIQEAYRTPNRLDQKRNFSWHIIITTTTALNKVHLDRILKAVREKGQVAYKGKPIRITSDFSPETMKAKRAWTDVIQTLREHKCQSRLLYPAKLSITILGETKVFYEKNKFTPYRSINPALQRIMTEKNKTKQNKQTNKHKTIQGWKPCPRKSKKVILQRTYRRQPQEQNANSNNKNKRQQQLLFLNIS